MASIKLRLKQHGFDWETGEICFHPTEEYYEDGQPMHNRPGWTNRIGEPKMIDYDDPIIDQEFSGGYGGDQCPRFIAMDKDAIYFPAQYDGATWVEKIYKSMDPYKKGKKETPYPGG